MSFEHFTVYNASAGSGKTYTITAELLKLMGAAPSSEPSLRPDQLIATTFTTKAADELQSRIRQKLLAAGLVDQARQLPSALIGTVNSVTSSLIQKFAIDAGLDPELSVLDEHSAQFAFRVATEEYIGALESENQALLQRMGYGLTEQNTSHYPSFAATVRRVVDLARTNGISAEQLPACATESVRTLEEALTQAEAGHPNSFTADEQVDVWERHFSAVLSDLAKLKEYFEEQSAVPGMKKAERTKVDTARRKVDEAVEAAVAARAAGFETWKDCAKEISTELKEYFNRPTNLIKEQIELLAGPTVGEKPLTVADDSQFRADASSVISLIFEAAGWCLVRYTEYKKALGLIDFVDQEYLTLQLITTNATVRDAIKAQYKVLVVDEFQDTSPLQLAVFMELSRLVEQVLWVGDPKQSIYRFRGADPQLMYLALEQIRQADTTSPRPDGRTRIQQLKHSYRTDEVPLDLSNQIFARAMTAVTAGPHEVQLSIDPQRRNAGFQQGGEVEFWEGDPESDLYDMVAAGIARELNEELAENGEISPSTTRAVLVRSNDEVRKVVSALAAYNIPYLGDYHQITESPQMHVLEAAIAYAEDHRDSVALIQLIQYLEDHPAHDDWLGQLSSAATEADRQERLNRWAEDDTLAPLRDIAAYTGVFSPVSFIQRAIDALGMVDYLARIEQPISALSSLDGALHVARQYEESAEAQGRRATLQGFVEFLATKDELHHLPTSRELEQPGAVFVGTMHGAKGLEWDRVYVVSKTHDAAAKFRASGAWVQPQSDMDMNAPLQNRMLYYWPLPISKFNGISEQLSQYPLQEQRRAAEIAEELRLYYVAFTRSKSATIVVTEGDFSDAFPELAEYINLSFSEDDSQVVIDVNREHIDEMEVKTQWHPAVASPAYVPVTRRRLEEFSFEPVALESLRPLTLGYDVPADDAAGTTAADAAGTTAADAAGTTAAHTNRVSPEISQLVQPENMRVPGRFIASLVRSSAQQKERTDAQLVSTIGPRLVDSGGKDWNRVGDAVHGFLALPLAEIDAPTREHMAQRLIERWGVAHRLQAGQLLAAADAWLNWVEQTYPGARIQTEVPFAWTSPLGQSVQGWFDTIIEWNDQVIIVDHKTYPGDNPQQHLLDEYVGQMTVYYQVIAHVTGAPPAAIIMHLPLRGEVWQLVVDQHPDQHPNKLSDQHANQ